MATKTWTSQADWQAGTQFNIDTTTTAGDLLLNFQNDVGGSSLVNGSTFTNRIKTGAGNWNFSGANNIANGVAPTGTNEFWWYNTVSTATGYWRLGSPGFSNNTSFTYVRYLNFMFNAFGTLGSNDFSQGYSLRVTGTGGNVNAAVALCRHDSSALNSEVVIGSFTSLTSDYTNAGVLSNYAVIRYPGGKFVVWGLDNNGVRKGSGGSTVTPYLTVTDNTYTSGIYMGMHIKMPNATSTSPSVGINIGVVTSPGTSLPGTWQSAQYDNLTTPTGYGPLSTSQTTSGGTLTYYTMTSATPSPVYNNVLLSNFSSLAGWTQQNGQFSSTGGELAFNSGGSTQDVIYQANTRGYGKWKFTVRALAGGSDLNRMWFYLGNTLNLGTSFQGYKITNGYVFQMTFNATAAGGSNMTLNRVTGDAVNTTAIGAQVQFTNDASNHTIEIQRDAFGNWTVFRDGVSQITGNDNWYSTNGFVGFGGIYIGGTTGNTMFWDDLFQPSTDVWDAVTGGTTITSTPQRYNWVRADLNAPALVSGNNPSVQSITLTTLAATGSCFLAFDFS